MGDSLYSFALQSRGIHMGRGKVARKRIVVAHLVQRHGTSQRLLLPQTRSGDTVGDDDDSSCCNYKGHPYRAHTSQRRFGLSRLVSGQASFPPPRSGGGTQKRHINTPRALQRA